MSNHIFFLLIFVLNCSREAARAEAMEIKYRKMMEDNNVEKVLTLKSCLDGSTYKRLTMQLTATSLLFLSRPLYGLIFVNAPSCFVLQRPG